MSLAGDKRGEFFYRRRYLLWLILAINLLSSIYGYYWYRWQFEATPWTLWFFTPDCPWAATLMAVALGIFLFFDKKETWFQFLTYTILIKYGFWTVFVFTLYWARGGQNHSGDYIMLCLSHLGMLAEGLLFISFVRQKPWLWWLAAGWSAVDIYFDYYYPIRIMGRAAYGTYPYLPNDAHRSIILVMTIGITVCYLLVAFFVSWRHLRSTQCKIRGNKPKSHHH